MFKLMSKRVERRALSIMICFVLCLSIGIDGIAKQRGKSKSGSHPSSPGPTITPAARAMVEEATGIVCTQAKLDPKSSIAIDEMQARPSLPVDHPEALAGAERAQRVLPIAKTLVVSSLQQLVVEYNFTRSPMFAKRIARAIERVQAVRRIRPDVESRDNASVLLSRPHTILFGTIFLAGLRSDEGMISVLSHELMHIADGEGDSLRPLVSVIAGKAARLTGLDISGQRGEELTCDLIGLMAVRSYVSSSPDYESITRRLSRSIEHNCVEADEGDEDHLSPRNTIRALLSLHPMMVRELINDREERAPARK